MCWQYRGVWWLEGKCENIEVQKVERTVNKLRSVDIFETIDRSSGSCWLGWWCKSELFLLFLKGCNGNFRCWFTIQRSTLSIQTWPLSLPQIGYNLLNMQRKSIRPNINSLSLTLALSSLKHEHLHDKQLNKQSSCLLACWNIIVCDWINVRLFIGVEWTS